MRSLLSPLAPFQAAKTRFVADRRGSMATLFGITATAVMLTVGAGVDYGTALKVEASLSGASDAASLAAAKLVAAGVTDKARIEKEARDTFDANFAEEIQRSTEVDEFIVTPDFATSAVTVTARTDVDTRIMQLVGFRTMPVRATSTSKVEGNIIEISMMLDLTGSMEWQTKDNKGRKIEVLEKAAEDLVKTLIPESGGTIDEVRIALAPFDAGVNAGSLAKAVSGGKSSQCVLERASGSMDVDVSPKVSPLKAGSNCPKRAVLPLTDDRAALLARLDKLTTGGTTAGHLGTAWAFGLLSPNWSDVLAGSVPANYGAKDTRKIAILMTDGLYNTWNGSFGGDYGPSAVKSQAAAVDICTTMKNAGITVYAIGFELNDAAAKKTLKDCATVEGGTSLFYDAKDGQSLLDAYRAIAASIQRLRLSV